MPVSLNNTCCQLTHIISVIKPVPVSEINIKLDAG